MGINILQVQKRTYVCATLLSLALGYTGSASANSQNLTSEYEDDKLPRTLPRKIEFDVSDLEKDNSPLFYQQPRSGIIGDPPSKPLFGNNKIKKEEGIDGSQKLSQASSILHQEMMNSLLNPNDPEVKDKMNNILRVTRGFENGVQNKVSFLDRLTESIRNKSSRVNIFLRNLL